MRFTGQVCIGTDESELLVTLDEARVTAGPVGNYRTGLRAEGEPRAAVPIFTCGVIDSRMGFGHSDAANDHVGADHDPAADEAIAHDASAERRDVGQ